MNKCMIEGRHFVNVSYKTRENCLGKLLPFLLCHIIDHLKSRKYHNDENFSSWCSIVNHRVSRNAIRNSLLSLT
jgi:hypothetical protein